MPHAVVSSHLNIQDFLEHSAIGQDLRRAATAGDVIVVPSGEGSNQVQAHDDMQGYLKGRTLRDAVEATSASRPAVPDRASPAAHPGKRRPG